MMRAAHLASGIIILVMISVSIYGANVISADTLLPIHWGINGEADRYVRRDIALIFIPVFGAILSTIFAAIPFIDPRRENVRRSVGLYYASWFGPLCLTLIIHVTIVLSAAQSLAPSPHMILLPACVLVIALGNYMTKSRSSWFIGLRTPWSLTSERAWISANRTTGVLFVLSGVISGAVAIGVEAQWGFTMLAASLLSSALIGVVVSYQAWRHDRERAQ